MFKKLLPAIYFIGVFISTPSKIQAQNNGLNFDGTDDYVSIPHAASFNVSAITVEAWINTNTYGTQHIASKNGSWDLRLDGNLNLKFEVIGLGTVTSNYQLSDVTWIHVAATFNGATASLYIDGNFAGSTNLSGNIVNNTNPILIGKSTAVGEVWNGMVDEVRIWNTAKAMCEIHYGKDCELSGNETSLIAYYNFNQGTTGGSNTSITSLTDIAGGDDNGTLHNFVLAGATSNWVTATNGVNGNCAAVNIPEIIVEANGISIVDGTTTISTAINTDYGTYAGTFIQKTYTITNTGTGMLDLSPGVSISQPDNDFIVSTAPDISLAAGASTSFVISFAHVSSDTINAIVFVGSNDCDEGTYSFNIRGIGVKRNGLAFRSNFSNHVQLLTNAALDFGVNTPFTIEAWVIAGGSGTRGIITRTQNATSDIQILKSSTGAVSVDLTTSLGSCGIMGVAPINDGNWHHIALVVERGLNPSASLYVDGALDAQTSAAAQSNLNGSFTSGTNFQLGRDKAGSGYYSGTIDEVRFWNVAKSSCEIVSNRACEMSPGAANLLAYYNFNQGIPKGNNVTQTILYDATSNAINGTLNNFTLTGSNSNWIATNNNYVSGNCSGGAGIITVLGNNVTISNGDVTPSVTDNTEFGTTHLPLSNGSFGLVSHSFTIKNTGSGNLTLPGSPVISSNNTGEIYVNYQPQSVLAPNAQTNFGINFMPSTVGLTTATITINSTDCNTNAYKFVVQGTGCDILAPADVTPLNNLSVCAGTSTTLSVTATGTVKWYSAATGGAYLGTGTTFNTPTITASTYFYAQDSTFCGVSTRTPIQINVHTPPIITITSTNSSICSGSSTTLSATGGIGNYTWSPVLDSSPIQHVSPSTSTLYAVTALGANGCTGTGNILITVIDPSFAVVPVIGGTNTICAGESASFSTTNTSNSYLWSTGETTNGISVSPIITTTYSVVGTQASCTITNTYTVTVNPNPTVTTSVSNPTVCMGQVLSVSAFGADDYTWMPNAMSGSTITISVVAPITYSVVGTNTLTSCFSSMKEIVVSVNNNLLPTVTISGDNTTICNGQTVTLTASGALTYVWVDGETTDVIALTPNTVKEYSVVGTDANGCSAGSSVYTVYINPAGITGTVYYGGMPLSGNASTYAKLYKYETGKKMQVLDSVGISGSGVYHFDAVTLAVPSLIFIHSDDASTAGTYYDETPYWTSAAQLMPNCPDAVADITIVPIPLLTGNRSISGKIVEGQGYSIPANVGNGIGGTEVAVKKLANADFVKYVTTSTSGNYSINNLPNGDYEMYVNIPGLPMVNNYTISLSTSNTSAIDIDFEVDSNQIEKKTSSSIKQITHQSFVSIFPNPAQEVVYVNIDSKERYALDIIITDSFGRSILTNFNTIVQPGSNNIALNTENFANGMYWLQMRTPTTLITEKLLIAK